MPIQILSLQLANQIAAGEVVERPASVVKELLENSIDAGATQIDIDIEEGGVQLIRIRDNGDGIAQEELELALRRHATSKINSLEQLQQVMTLGFRGEALASISAVSRLTIISRTKSQEQAWKIYSDGGIIQEKAKPCSHPVGSTLEVLDLFYNTPARRKFLRSSKTEFFHINEVVRRLALGNFDIGFTLSHNGKRVRRYEAVTEQQSNDRRLAALCGSSFLTHARAFCGRQNTLAVRGWITTALGARNQGDVQYSYVNGRLVRDKIINHAVRQAYHYRLNDQQYPAFILFLTLEPQLVDMNVHPMKQEVRFAQARMVHDVIYQVVSEAINSTDCSQQQKQTCMPARKMHIPNVEYTELSSRIAIPAAELSQLRTCQERLSTIKSLSDNNEIEQIDTMSVPEVGKLINHLPHDAVVACSLGRVLTVWQQRYAVVEQVSGLILLSLTEAKRCLQREQLRSSTRYKHRLLVPVSCSLSASEQQCYHKHQALLNALALQMHYTDDQLVVYTVPIPLHTQSIPDLIAKLLNYLISTKSVDVDLVIEWLLDELIIHEEPWQLAQAIQLLTEVERCCPMVVKKPTPKLQQPIDLSLALARFTSC